MRTIKKGRRWPAHITAVVFSLFALSDAHAAPLGIEQAREMALKNNPGLASAGKRAAALSHLPSQVSTLPDPRLSLNAMNLPTDSFSTTQENMTQLQIGLSQDIPFPGKLRLKGEAARLEAEAARLDVDEFRLQLIRNVRIAWWNLFYLDRALEIVRRNQALLRQFITIAQTRYKVGKGLQQDVLLAQVELSRLLDVEIRLKGARRKGEARLNALLNRETDTPIEIAGEKSVELPAAQAEASLHRLALAQRPLLQEKNRLIDAARSREDLARKDYYPDFRLGAGYGFRQGNNTGRTTSRADFLSVGVSLNLPIFTADKQDRALQQRQAELARAQFDHQDAVEAVRNEVSSALADYRKAREQARLFKTGIIPQASQTVASMLAGYQVGKVDFLNLVRAQITLYNYETRYWQAVSQARQAQARLDAAAGEHGTITPNRQERTR